MRLGRRFGLAAACVGLTLLAVGGEARAGYQATLTGSPVGLGGGLFQYNYAVSDTLATGEQVAAGNFFRFYDVSGYQSAIAASSWGVTTAFSNPTPPPNVILQHGDDPGVLNVTFTYSGPTLTSGGALGTFSLVSSSGPATSIKDFVGTTSNAATVPPSGIDTRLDILVPSAVPEPAGLVSAGVGLALLGLGYARRRLN